MTDKQCTKCKRVQPMTNFYVMRAHHTGFDALCKQCRKAEYILRAQRTEAELAAQRPETKVCTKCKRDLPASAFSKDSQKKDGLRFQCKECRVKVSRTYAKNNTRRVAENQRRYRQENLKHLVDYKKKWDAENTYVLKANAEAYRARKKSVDTGTVTAAVIEKMIADQDGLCAYCEEPLEDFHIEHMIPLIRGGLHHWTNIAISCPPCNRRKHKKTAEEFMEGRGLDTRAVAERGMGSPRLANEESP